MSGEKASPSLDILILEMAKEFGVPPWVLEEDLIGKWWWVWRTYKRVEGEVQRKEAKAQARKAGRQGRR